MKTYSIAGLLALLVIVARLSLPSVSSHNAPMLVDFDVQVQDGRALLSWETQGMRDDDRLDLQLKVGNEWLSILPRGDRLPPSGQRSRLLPDFQPLTWRLVLLNADGQIIEHLS